MIKDNYNLVFERQESFKRYGVVSSLRFGFRGDEKYTGKEFDEEGAQFGQLEIDISLNFALTHTDPLKPNRMAVYFTDAPNDPTKAEVIYAEIDPVTNFGKFKKTINLTEDREIAWIHFMLNDDAVSCAVEDIDELVGPGAKVDITKSTISLADFTATVDKSFLNYSRDDDYHLAGTGLFYFGARYYDPEIGIWLATDPAEQFYNPYSYSGNPIIMIDPDGRWFGQLVAQMAIGAAVNGASYVSAGGEFGDRGFWASTGIGAASGALNFGTQAILGNVTNFTPVVNGFLEVGITAVGTALLDAGEQTLVNGSRGSVNWGRAWTKGAWAGGISALNVIMNGAMVNPDYFNNQLTRQTTTVDNDQKPLTELQLANKKLSEYSKKNINLSKGYQHIRYGGLANQYKDARHRNPGVTKHDNNIYMARRGNQQRWGDDLNTYLHEQYHRTVSNDAGSDFPSEFLPGANRFPGTILVP